MEAGPHAAEMVSQLVLFPAIGSPFCERTQEAMCRIGNLDFSQQFWRVVGNYLGMCQAGPRYPHEDHHEAVACTGCETSDGLDGEVEWKEEG